MNYFVYFSKINHIYNLNNGKLIFMGEHYLIIKYDIKNKEFSPCVIKDFLLNEDNDYNHYEIKCLNDDFIILNNYDRKIFYIIDGNHLIKKISNYYSNLFVYKNFLLFDEEKDNNIIQYKAMDLLNKSIGENTDLIELLNSRLDFNYPKIILFSEFNTMISLYEKNQICIIDFTTEQNIFKNVQNNNIINIKIKPEKEFHPKIIQHSNFYSSYYDPIYLFDNSSYYYCSSDENDQYFQLDLCKDYFIPEIKFEFDNYYKDCIPKNYSLKLYTNKSKEIIIINSIFNQDVLNQTIKINQIVRIIVFNFRENYGGNYIIIKKIRFNGMKLLRDI